MPNILNSADAINRVRTILDRGNSPWMSDVEISDFISMAGNEYIRERVGKYGATQAIRDDLGKYVRTYVFGNNEEIPNQSYASLPYNPDFPLQEFAINTYNVNSQYSFDVSLITGDTTTSAATYDFGGHYSRVGCNLDLLPKKIGYVLGIKIITRQYTSNAAADSSPLGFPDNENYPDDIQRHHNVKIISLDDAQAINNDPFNKPDENHYRAVRVSNVYYIMPDDFWFTEDNPNLTVTEQDKVIFDVIIDDFDVDNMMGEEDGGQNEMYLPYHSKEEICQIASRKILGTTADERYMMGDNEIKQLENK
tara:strand:- start:1223 stop:2146 length:924 start_codon:yes stop_codon:yes gene_type:complete